MEQLLQSRLLFTSNQTGFRNILSRVVNHFQRAVKIPEKMQTVCIYLLYIQEEKKMFVLYLTMAISVGPGSDGKVDIPNRIFKTLWAWVTQRD